MSIAVPTQYFTIIYIYILLFSASLFQYYSQFSLYWQFFSFLCSDYFQFFRSWQFLSVLFLLIIFSVSFFHFLSFFFIIFLSHFLLSFFRSICKFPFLYFFQISFITLSLLFSVLTLFFNISDWNQSQAWRRTGKAPQVARGRSPWSRADPAHPQEEAPGVRGRLPGPDWHPYQV